MLALSMTQRGFEFVAILQ